MSAPFVSTPESNFSELADFSFPVEAVEVDGVTLRYVDSGEGSVGTALMVHGMPTWSYLYREIMAPLVEAGWRCVAVDHVGFGRSDKVTDPSWYTISRHVENLRSVIEHLDLSDITLFVQDWGGPIGLAQYRIMPERFSRLVIMNTWLEHDGFEYTPGVRAWIEQWVEGGLFVSTIPDSFSLGGIVAFATGRADARALLGAVLAGEEPQYEGEGLSTCRAYDAPFAGLGENGVVGAKRFPLCIPLNDPVSGDAEGQRLTYQAVNRTELPVHFIWGEADTIFSKEWGQTWASRIPHATYDGLESAQHFLQETHGREIANIVLQYAQ